MATTVLAIADQTSPLLYEYFRRERWQHIDLVLSCGDLPPEYLDLLTTTLGVPVLYVRGNHDARYPRELYDGSENMHGRVRSVSGIRVAGFEGCRRYNQGACQYTEAQMRRLVHRSQRESLRLGPPDIVLTHAPPAGYHDREDPCHRGFECFLEAIDRWQPAFFIHGHTHAYDGADAPITVGQTTVINAFPYVELTLDTEKRRVAEGGTAAPMSRARSVYQSVTQIVSGSRVAARQ